MEMSDDYQDMVNPGGGVAMGNIQPMGHHRHTPESPLSHQEDDLSDPDLQDEESGEELPQQPHAGHSTHQNPTDPSSISTNTTPTPLTNLNTLMNTHHPHFLAKLKMEADVDILNNKSGLEALQAAMGSGGFSLPFSFPPTFLPPQHHGQNNHAQSGLVPSTSSAAAAAAAVVALGSGLGAGLGPPGLNTASGSNINQATSSASSHSSESSQCSGKTGGEVRDAGNNHSHNTNNNNATSNHQQQTSWSFEEQFKQLYEINDDPKRKEFLDDLFSYMQKRGTPINRLPIMAKSVLDLYELYNLVIARGGLVDVINKKLWQEIIKGLHLPSSITSAAFTLRTQYMKYLYPYECEKRRLSTPAELQAAIDGNRREGRRSSYGTYAAGGPGNEGLVQRNPPNSLALRAQMSPLSLVTAVSGHHGAGQSLVNGHSAHTNLPHHHHHHPHHAQHAQGPLSQPPTLSMSNLAPSEFEARMVEYVKLLNKELRNAGAGTPPPIINRQGSSTPPPSTPPKDANTSNYEMSRLTLWGMYGNNNPIYSAVIHQPSLSPQTSQSPLQQASSPEPQREALDLGLRSSPVCSSPSGPSPLSSGSSFHTRKDNEQGPPAAKRLLCDEDNPPDKNPSSSTGTHIKICNRGDGKNGENSLVVSVELNGVTYQGVLFAQTDSKNATSSSSSSTTLTHNENGKTSRSIAS
ncbi:protein dead ringer-like isoform X2 [Vespula pensylvanica]|uniref:protein dead ringer-like isoform X2 n=1 Tax=Vespula pensylvanica TaxID=30213 RepID=UPI001CBA173D|nr:protein dead ringer-like isoform X2 [Vespula pensylvanica]